MAVLVTMPVAVAVPSQGSARASGSGSGSGNGSGREVGPNLVCKNKNYFSPKIIKLRNANVFFVNT